MADKLDLTDLPVSPSQGGVAITLDAFEVPLPQPGQLAAIAMITHREGASYRPLGAAMTLDIAGNLRGQLSGGCIDADIEIHLRNAVKSRRARTLRYGTGSPFRDLVLPCGGALEVTVYPAPEHKVQDALCTAIRTRKTVTLHATPADLRLEASAEDLLALTLQPDPRFAVFGAGPEAEAFARLAAASGYKVRLASPEPAAFVAVDTVALSTSDPLAGMDIDARTAIVTFFHDHDREIPILRDAIRSKAFFIGAQGSQRTARNRQAQLEALGCAPRDIARIRGPVGLIERARNPRVLAVSVLAEALSAA